MSIEVAKDEFSLPTTDGKTQGQKLYEIIEQSMRLRDQPAMRWENMQDNHPSQCRAFEDAAAIVNFGRRPTTWEQQQGLMEVNGHEVPEQMKLSAQSLGYLAGMLDAMAQATHGIYNAIHSAPSHRMLSLSVRDAAAFSNAADLVGDVANQMQMLGGMLRDLVQENFGHRDVSLPFDESEAINVIGGLMSAAVAHAGVVLSMGAPAHECFEDALHISATGLPSNLPTILAPWLRDQP